MTHVIVPYVLGINCTSLRIIFKQLGLAYDCQMIYVAGVGAKQQCIWTPLSPNVHKLFLCKQLWIHIATGNNSDNTSCFKFQITLPYLRPAWTPYKEYRCIYSVLLKLAQSMCMSVASNCAKEFTVTMSNIVSITVHRYVPANASSLDIQDTNTDTMHQQRMGNIVTDAVRSCTQSRKID